MTGPLVKLMSCRDAIAAETIRNRLEAAGIMAVVQGAEVGTALSYVGVAIGYPNIEVEEKDLKRAEELLEADRISLQTAGAWTCSRCSEFNEPAFEVCWSCNKTRSDEDERASMDPEEIDPSQPEIVHSSGLTSETSAATLGDAANPYRPIEWAHDQPHSPEISTAATIENEDKESINRAFIAAVIGGVFPVMIFTIYSLAILIRLSLRSRPHKLNRTTKYYATWAINLLVSIVAVAFLFG